MPDQNWQFELEEYIKQGEPDRAEKSEAWQTAIGLQAVDGLNTSAYLLDTAKDHIEGKITIDEAQQRIHSYYEQRTTRTEIENETKEADIVSARIAKLLGEKTFQFSPAEWITIHRRLFEGVFDHARQIRKYNISKKEWILNGETVIYADFNSIKDTLDYDFATEKQFSYEGLSVEASVKHLAKFASDIWQIHPFGEGNTRATAVFMIKYMKTFGFRVNNDAFRENSWYFRNALVRANYNDLQKGIHSTTKFLELATVYTAIAAFENMVRQFVVKILMENKGENWWTECVSDKIRKSADSRKAEEDKIKWHTHRGTSMINYVDFADLANIMGQNYDLFEVHIVSLEWAKQIFTTLEKSRNVIMHSGELGERDIERIGINIRDWISQVGA